MRIIGHGFSLSFVARFCVFFSLLFGICFYYLFNTLYYCPMLFLLYIAYPLPSFPTLVANNLISYLIHTKGITPPS